MEKNRREFIKILGSVAALSFVPGVLYASQKSDDSKIRLTILSTNDQHSRLEPFPSNDKKYPNQGGYAQRAALINSIRQEEDNVLLLDAGDVFQGTPFFNIYGGELEFKLMSKMGYDACTIGNHEFDNGLNGLSKAFDHAKFPFICSNYDFSDTVMKDKTIPYKIIEKGELKIGIIGIGVKLEGLVSSKSYGNTKYLDPIEKANEYAKLLKEKSCDFIICLSHLGVDYPVSENKIGDVEFVSKTRNIDYLIGGHTHTFMEAPLEVKNLDGKLVKVSHSGWGGLRVGRLDLEFDSKKNLAYEPTYTLKKVKKQA